MTNNTQYLNSLNALHATSNLLSKNYFQTNDPDTTAGLNLIYKSHFIKSSPFLINNYAFLTSVKIIEQNATIKRTIDVIVNVASNTSNTITAKTVSLITSLPKELPKPVPTTTVYNAVLVANGIQVKVPVTQEKGITIIGQKNNSTSTQIQFQNPNSIWNMGPLLNELSLFYDFIFEDTNTGVTLLQLTQDSDTVNVLATFNIYTVSNFYEDMFIPTSSIVLGNDLQGVVINPSGELILTADKGKTAFAFVVGNGVLSIENKNTTKTAFQIDGITNNITIYESIAISNSLTFESFTIHNNKNTIQYEFTVNNTNNALQISNLQTGISNYIYQDGSLYLENNLHVSNSMFVENNAVIYGNLTVSNSSPYVELTNTTANTNWSIVNTGTILSFEYDSRPVSTLNEEGNITVSGSINTNVTYTVITGNYSNGVFGIMPFQGTSYKKALLYFNDWLAGNTSQNTYTFTTSFSYQPYMSSKVLDIVIGTLTTSYITFAATNTTSPYNGIISIEGL